MTKHKQILLDVKQILETIGRVSFVSLQGHKNHSSGNAAEVYLVPGADSFEQRVNGKSINSYDNSFFVRVIINEDCSDDELQWAETKDEVISAILNDTDIWDNLIDRDVYSVVYDDLNTFPKVTLEIQFEFTIREVCN